MVATAIAIEFCVSANLLTWIGVPYITEGGVFLEKIHPGTYMICLAFLTRSVSSDLSNTAMLLVKDGKLATYIGSLLFCMAYMLLTTGAGNVIVLIDTYLPAGLLAWVVQDASGPETRLVLGVFRWGVCANAILALWEAAAHATLVPLYLNDAAYHAADGEFRPTAFYDHPLTGGVMTLIGLALAPSGRMGRVAYLMLLATALIAFGGRVAVGVAVMSTLFLSLATLTQTVLRRDPAALRFLAYFGLSIISSVVIATFAFEVGFGNRLLGHLYWDPSAQVRIAQWQVLGNLDGWQVTFGTRREDLLALLTSLWLNSGVEAIENFWLLMFISLGVVGFPFFVLGLLTFRAWCGQRTDIRGRVLLVAVMIVVSTSNSLSRKSTLLVGLVAAVSCLRTKMPTEKDERMAVPSRHADSILVGSSK
jgi:hypothetical protein